MDHDRASRCEQRWGELPTNLVTAFNSLNLMTVEQLRALPPGIRLAASTLLSAVERYVWNEYDEEDEEDEL